MPIATGARVSGYEIIAPIGAGGMGEVYRARDVKLDRQVALKILPASFTRDPERVRRFTAEARIASSLNHPHLVAIYDVGEFADGAGERAHFIAMELVDGVTLREQIDGERMPLKKTLLLLAQTADALAAAHRAGIAHRDIKPENILISRDGYAKVVDFGLAKLREPLETDGSNETAVMRGTEPGLVMGTLGYMSPEQAEGKSADHRSDVFSLGCVIYEAVSGRRAFEGTSRVDTLHKIISANPQPLADVAPVAPLQLQWILRKCLAKDPDARYQSMKDLAIDLRELASDLDSGLGTPAAVATQRRSLLPWIAVVLAVIAVIAMAVLSRNNRRTAAHPIDMQRLTDLGNVIEAALSPDGKYLAYVTSSQGKQALWLKQLGSAQVVPIRPAESVAYWGHTFSPDGTSIYYGMKNESHLEGALYRVATLGGMPTLVTRGIDSTVGFSPDGSKITFVRANFPTAEESALLVANSDGSGERVIAKRHEPEFLSRQFFAAPSWSHDGKWIAFAALRTKGADEDTRIRAVPVEGGEEVDISNGQWDRVGQLAWLPDGDRLIAVCVAPGNSNAQLWEIPFPSGTPRRITQDLLDHRIVSLARDGKSLVTIPSDMESAIWSVPAGGGDPVRLTSGRGDGVAGFAQLADGSLLFTSTESGTSDLWVMSPDRTERHPLFTKSAVRREPAVSGNGTILAYVTTPQRSLRFTEAGFSSLARALVDGTGERLLASSHIRAPSLTPDGKWIIYSTRVAGESRLAKISSDGGAPQVLTSYLSDAPAVSPDGTRIACICREKPSDPVGVCILPFNGGPPTKIYPVRYDSASAVRWTRDGKALLFNGGVADRANVRRQPLDGGPSVKLTNFSDAIVFDFEESNDGKVLFLTRVNLIRDAVLIRGFD